MYNFIIRGSTIIECSMGQTTSAVELEDMWQSLYNRPTFREEITEVIINHLIDVTSIKYMMEHPSKIYNVDFSMTVDILVVNTLECKLMFKIIVLENESTLGGFDNYKVFRTKTYAFSEVIQNKINIYMLSGE